MQLSSEQKAIVQAAKEGKNLIINAVAGAGKTFTTFAIAGAIPAKEIIQVTYNRKLKQEVRKKVKDANISNMHVSNYHALCLDYYGLHTDIAMVEVILGIRKHIALPEKLFDVMIIDEAQDKTPEYYKFLRVFSQTHCVPNFQLIVMGDVMQSVYDFKLASPLYLSHADHYWPGKHFERLKISTSFRITSQVAECVNGLAGRDIIFSSKVSKTNCKVTLLSSYNGGCPKELKTVIEDLINKSINASDLMIIIPSADSSYATAFINRIVSKGIPVYKQSDSEDSSNEKYSRGKVLVCTYHTSKGLERDTVVMFNFDQTYYSIYQQEKNPKELIPTLYVGMTRALSRLYLVENGDRLTYLTPKVLLNLNVCPNRGVPREGNFYIRETYSVTKLIKFLSVQLLYDIDKDVNALFKIDVPAETCLKIKQDIKGLASRKEYVADLTGIAVGEMIEDMQTSNGCKALRSLDRFEGSLHISRDYIEEELADIEQYKTGSGNDGNEMEYYLRLCNLHEASRTGHLYRYRQIKNYQWISNEHKKIIVKRLQMIRADSDFQRGFAREVIIGDGRIVVVGELDSCLLTGECKQVVEIKCTKELTIDHKLQILFYAWIMQDLVQDWNTVEFVLLNVLTNETLVLECDLEKINDICKKIINYKLKI